MSCLGRVLRLTMVSLCCNCCSNCPSSCPCWDHPLQRTSFSSHYNHPQSSSSFILQTAVSPLHSTNTTTTSAAPTNSLGEQSFIFCRPNKQGKCLQVIFLWGSLCTQVSEVQTFSEHCLPNSFFNQQLLRSHVVFVFIGHWPPYSSSVSLEFKV